MAHGGLLDFQPLRRLGHVAFRHQGVKGDEKIEIERTKIEMIDSYHEPHRFVR
jgi:hypothetical protein